MSTTTSKVNLTLTHTDATSRTITFNDVPNTRTTIQIADAVNSINANMSDAFKHTFLSANGAPCNLIGKAQLITTEEEVIYNASN